MAKFGYLTRVYNGSLILYIVVPNFGYLTRVYHGSLILYIVVPTGLALVFFIVYYVIVFLCGTISLFLSLSLSLSFFLSLCLCVCLSLCLSPSFSRTNKIKSDDKKEGSSGDGTAFYDRFIKRHSRMKNSLMVEKFKHLW